MIKKSEWLTREGRQALNKELRERDDNARRAAGHYDAPSDLTVGMVFSKRHKLKVWIQIRKRHKYPTQYMLCESADSLLRRCPQLLLFQPTRCPMDYVCGSTPTPSGAQHCTRVKMVNR